LRHVSSVQTKIVAGKGAISSSLPCAVKTLSLLLRRLLTVVPFRVLLFLIVFLGHFRSTQSLLHMLLSGHRAWNTCLPKAFASSVKVGGVLNLSAVAAFAVPHGRRRSSRMDRRRRLHDVRKLESVRH
jgi:hypothetical protein